MHASNQASTTDTVLYRKAVNSSVTYLPFLFFTDTALTPENMVSRYSLSYFQSRIFKWFSTGHPHPHHKANQLAKLILPYESHAMEHHFVFRGEKCIINSLTDYEVRYDLQKR